MSEEIANLADKQTSAVEKSGMPGWILPVLLILFAIGLGVFTGYHFSGKQGKTAVSLGGGIVPEGNITKGSEFGSKDTAKFKDTATGIIEVGGKDGEGTHKLIREGGPSQMACLMSSVFDLDQFVGRKVQVWGESFQPRKCGWLMDIGRIKVLE